MSFIEVISPIEDVIEEARNGRLFILVDDEDREDEGDLVIPAQMATPAVINFMAKHGRGLICLALTRQRVEQLRLPLMPQQNASRLRTAFTVSIEAREGVTTGISAPDRARTIATAIDPSKGPDDIETPGHIFPLMARDGGVLVRTGHTEAAVDIARLAGLNPSGVICEIMNDDGTMARREDLVRFAQFHGLKIATIADLIAYRRRHDRIVERRLETVFESKYGGHFKMHIYVNTVAHVEHIALVKGDIATPEPVPVRMHALNVLDDVLGSSASGRGGVLQIGKELHTFVDEKVDAAIVDHTPALERAAAEVAEHAARSAATEVAHEEVRALESRTRDAHQELTNQIHSVSHQTVHSLTGQIDEAKQHAQSAVLETAQNLVVQIKEAARRVGDTAHAEVNQKVEELHERSRQSYAQVHERLDVHDQTGQALLKQFQEEQRNRKTENQALKAEIQKLTSLLRSANDRLAELEKPRGLRAWLGRLFGKGKKKSAAAQPSTSKTPELAAKKTLE